MWWWWWAMTLIILSREWRLIEPYWRVGSYIQISRHYSHFNNSMKYLIVFLLSLAASLHLPPCDQPCNITYCSLCNTTCTACISGYTLASNTCTPNPCSISDCLRCDTHGACIKCSDPYSTVDASNGSCVQMCSLAHCKLCLPNSNIC